MITYDDALTVDSGTAHFWVFLVNLVLIQLFICSFVCGITQSYFYN